MISKSRKNKIKLNHKVRTAIIREVICSSLIYGSNHFKKAFLDTVRESTIGSISKSGDLTVVELLYDDARTKVNDLYNNMEAIVFDKEGNIVGRYFDFTNLKEDIYKNKMYIHSKSQEEIEYMLFKRSDWKDEK